MMEEREERINGENKRRTGGGGEQGESKWRIVGERGENKGGNRGQERITWREGEKENIREHSRREEK